MKAIFSKEIPVGVSMCDAAGRLSHASTFALFQDIAGEHAEQLGVGYADMTARSSFWMTVRTKVHFYKRPGIMDRINISTWPMAPGSTRCDRCYRLSCGDEILAEGRTEWCVYDLEKGKVKPVSEAGFIDGLEYLEEAALPQPYARFRHNFTDDDLACSHIVPASDIDMGRHMNNVAYLRALLNSFSVQELEAMNIAEMEIMFYLPCFEGDRLDILRRETGFGYEFGVRRPDGRYAALAQLRTEAK